VWLGSRVVSVLDSGAEGPGFKSQPPLPLQCFTSVISRSHKVLDVQSHTELISSKVLQTPQTFHCIYQRFTDENCNLDPTRPTIACRIIFAHRSSVVTSCCSTDNERPHGRCHIPNNTCSRRIFSIRYNGPGDAPKIVN